jgi:Pilin accessory protein (PilO)
MATYTTQIGKHKFICGLFWQSLSRPRDLWRESVELAKKIDADMLVLRQDHAMAQAGYAHSREGAQRGMYSLAAIISKSISLQGAFYDGRQQPVHNWLSAFRLPDGMWAYCAVRDSNFLPNGDFAGTKEEVLDRLHGDYGLGGWNVVIGDAELEDYGFHNFSAKQIEDLIPRKKDGQVIVHRWWALRPIQRKMSWKPLVAIGVVLVLLIIAGVFYWKQYQQKKEEQERERAIAAARQVMLGNAAPSLQPHPWPKQPLPQEFAQACMEKFVLLSPGGWLLDDYTCSATQASYAWSRKDSNIAYLLEQVPNAIVSMNGERATYVVPLRLKLGKEEGLLEVNTLLRPLLSRLQLLGLILNISQAPTAPQPLPGMLQKAPPKPDWQTISFTLNPGGLPLGEVAAMFSLPGVRLDKLSYRGDAWLIEGVFYAK